MAADFFLGAGSAAWSLVRILAALRLSACWGIAKMVGQDLAAAIKSAIDDPGTQGFNVRDGLVVVDHCGVACDVHRGGMHTRYAL